VEEPIKVWSDSKTRLVGHEDGHAIIGLQGVKLRLGDLTFDAGARQLRRGREDVHLSPKAFELLKCLIEARPRALSKNELHEVLWPATFVSESNLATLIAEIRDALGDTARQPRFIRTAHRYGYAFCQEDASDPEVAAPSEAPSFSWLVKDGKRLPLSPGPNVLGRDKDGIELDSVTVSRRHARITITGSDARVEDLDSKNGTFVNGNAVSRPVQLKDGDEIRTGSVVLRFRMTSPTGSTATWKA
jgi:DNA-binding winged helix-turn-helix (wHTH) protein